MDDNDDYSEISTDFKDDEDLPEILNESDSELDIAINEELISKSQEEIKKRMTSLSLLISGLKEQLRNEKELWRREIEQVINYQNSFMSHALCFPTYYNANWEEPPDFPKRICGTSRSDEDLPMKYGDFRYRHLKLTNCRRDMEIENYRRKLLEVESMCTMELNRVKNSVQSLQVLQQVAAEWDQASGDMGHKPVHHKSIQSPDEGDENSLKNSGDFSPTLDSQGTVEV